MVFGCLHFRPFAQSSNLVSFRGCQAKNAKLYGRTGADAQDERRWVGVAGQLETSPVILKHIAFAQPGHFK